MPEFPIRKVLVSIEDIFHDGGPAAAEPRRRGVAMALVQNPFAGRHEPELQGAMKDLEPLGLMLTERLMAAFGEAARIDAYGKGAIVGTAGEIEHGALWHVPLGHVNAAYVRSHFDAITVTAPDGPRPDEILFCLAMSCGGRVHARMGGLEAGDVKGEDGLR
jgi:hypothetical protein